MDQTPQPLIFNPMASLKGLVDEWDACPKVRQRMREEKTLFVNDPATGKATATVACAELNYHVLVPLVGRLEVSPGVLGMLKVPGIQKSTLASKGSCLLLVHKSFLLTLGLPHFATIIPQ